MARINESIGKIDKMVGQKIAELRIAKKMPRDKVAALIDITHQQLHKYEKGINRISAGRLAALAGAMGVPVSYFYEQSHFDSAVPLKKKKATIEMVENFMKIKSKHQQDMVKTLIQSLIENRA